MKRREAREKAVQTLFQLDNTELTLMRQSRIL